MSEDTNQKLFEAIVSAGLYLEYGAPGTGYTRTPRWEVCDFHGAVLGKGAERDEALNEAWRSFQREARKNG